MQKLYNLNSQSYSTKTVKIFPYTLQNQQPHQNAFYISHIPNLVPNNNLSLEIRTKKNRYKIQKLISSTLSLFQFFFYSVKSLNIHLNSRTNTHLKHTIILLLLILLCKPLLPFIQKLNNQLLCTHSSHIV